MEHNNNDRYQPLNLPKDISLPFFAYGIFKPRQLAYSKIKNLVGEETAVEINYEMKLRDGVPILTNAQRDYYKTKGFIITFKKGHEKEVYARISKTLLKNLYSWKTIEINGKEVNLVFGVDPENGSNFIEDQKERYDFDGKNDPFFKEAIELIETNLNSIEHSWDIKNLFELQMNYMLLWSAIDRYSSLKYNKPSKRKNNRKFAKEKTFKNGIKKYENKKHYPVYSTEDLKIHKFNANDSFETLEYYYTFRCNVVHRGKAMLGDYDKLKTATEELLEIFKEILNNTFN